MTAGGDTAGERGQGSGGRARIKNTGRTRQFKGRSLSPAPSPLSPFISRLLHLTQVGSTQTLAREMAQEGAPDWTVVWADRQTAGRGRLDRTWNSETGGLYFSLILRPKFGPKKLADLSLASADAAAKTIKKITGLRTVVKPPNDVYAFSSHLVLKVCGILAEARGTSRSLDWLVLGVGINVNNDPKSENSSSLKALTGREWSVEALLQELLNALRRGLRRL